MSLTQKIGIVALFVVVAGTVGYIRHLVDLKHQDQGSAHEEAYEACRSKFTIESDCFNKRSTSECLENIEHLCGSP